MRMFARVDLMKDAKGYVVLLPKYIMIRACTAIVRGTHIPKSICMYCGHILGLHYMPFRASIAMNNVNIILKANTYSVDV